MVLLIDTTANPQRQYPASGRHPTNRYISIRTIGKVTADNSQSAAGFGRSASGPTVSASLTPKATLSLRNRPTAGAWMRGARQAVLPTFSLARTPQ
jgi:hypothetical protein